MAAQPTYRVGGGRWGGGVGSVVVAGVAKRVFCGGLGEVLGCAWGRRASCG